ncbi:MAG: hypothetical protein U1E49_13940 [Hyphomicrobiaceae bacterium]
MKSASAKPAARKAQPAKRGTFARHRKLVSDAGRKGGKRSTVRSKSR